MIFGIYRSVLIVILLPLLSKSFGQNERIAYDDAIKFAEQYKEQKKEPIVLTDSTLAALKYYFGDSVSISNDPVNGYKGNRFLKKYFTSLASAGGSNKSIALPDVSPNRALPSGLNVTNLAEGLAQFMIKRAKEELTVAFFNRFKKFADDHPEFRTLFPKTTANLAQLLTYQYPEMLNILRAGFYDDLQALVDHLDDLLSQDVYKQFPEIKITVKLIRLIREMEAGDINPAEALSQFAALSEWKNVDLNRAFKNSGTAIKIGNIFSQSLRSRDPSRIWIEDEQLKALVKDTVAFDIYLGLVYQIFKQHKFRFYQAGRTINLNDRLENAFTQIDDLKHCLRRFIKISNDIHVAEENIQFKRNMISEVTREDIYQYVDPILQSIELGFTLVKQFDHEIKVDQDFVQECTNLFRNIYREEYAPALINTTNLLNHLYTHALQEADGLISSFNKVNCVNKLPESISDIRREDLDRAGVGLEGKDTCRSRLDRITSIHKIEKNFGKALPQITKYGLFIANMAMAKSPEEVEKILENTVLPVGSSSIKKNSYYNLSVQSYLGAYALLNTSSNGQTTAWNDALGVHAPVGIAISKGFARGGSLSIFTSLLDIGAIVDYNLTQDTLVGNSLQKDYEIQLGQIFSPGFYLVYGLPFNIPLSIGVGKQYGPGLSKVEVIGTTVVNNPGWRWNAFLSVDIPLFTLKNKTRYYW